MVMLYIYIRIMLKNKNAKCHVYYYMKTRLICGRQCLCMSVNDKTRPALHQVLISSRIIALLKRINVTRVCAQCGRYIFKTFYNLQISERASAHTRVSQTPLYLVYLLYCALFTYIIVLLILNLIMCVHAYVRTRIHTQVYPNFVVSRNVIVDKLFNAQRSVRFSQFFS